VHHVGILYDQFMMHGQRNIKLFRRKQSMFHRTAILEKLIMLTVISQGDLCTFKSSDDSLAGPKHDVIKYGCQFYNYCSLGAW